MISRILTEIWLAPRNLAIAIMKTYRRLISPLYGQVCRYHPSCSRYSLEAYQARGALLGFVLTLWRLVRCNPFTPGGIDDVPLSKNPHYVTNSHGFVRPITRKA